MTAPNLFKTRPQFPDVSTPEPDLEEIIFRYYDGLGITTEEQVKLTNLYMSKVMELHNKSIAYFLTGIED